jgi:hypothetical protein
MNDPNYNEVSTDVDMYVERNNIKPFSFIKKIIDKIILVIKRFWDKIDGREEIEMDDKIVDVLSKLIVEESKKVSFYAVKNKINGNIVLTNGNIEILKKQFDSNNYEITEMSVHDENNNQVNGL